MKFYMLVRVAFFTLTYLNTALKFHTQELPHLTAIRAQMRLKCYKKHKTYAHYILALSRNHCCHGNETIPSHFIVFGVHVAVKNKTLFSVVMEMQQWVPFSLLLSYNVFRTALKNNRY